MTAAIARVERMVLLGDVIELRERPFRDALAAASRVLPQLAEALPAGAEIVVVAGNHDHEISRPGEIRAGFEEMLSGSGAAVRFAYPGLWLREDVYATHGHYLDVHTTTPAPEHLAAALMARLRHERVGRIDSVERYERVLAPIYAWLRAIAETSAAGDGAPAAELRAAGGSSGVLRSVRAGGPRAYAARLAVIGAAAAVRLLGLGPVSADLSSAQIRRAGLAAFAEVLAALRIEPAYAIFGHTHHAGPLPGADLGEWVTGAGTRLLNAGCWIDRPSFLGPDPARSPYRPGFAVELGELGPPRLVNLLDR